MSTIPPPNTLAEAEFWYCQYAEAELKILSGQEYSIGSRHLTRANLAVVQAEKAKWNARLRAFQQGGGIRVTQVVPRSR